MTAYDVFNGDADGLCALQQLRLAHPTPSELVTGVKRDIQLLNRVSPGPGDAVTVLDISLDSNRDDLMRILASGARVTWVDHHYTGAVPEHEAFQPHLDTSTSVCTSLLVDGILEGQHRLWAIVGAAGDNLDAAADALGASLLADGQMERAARPGPSSQLQQLRPDRRGSPFRPGGPAPEDASLTPAPSTSSTATASSPG